MSDEVWKGRACSGIPKNVGGSIKREHVAAFDVCQGSPCRPHNPGIGTIAGGSAQYARLGPIASGPPVRHRTVHRMVFRDSHPCGKLSANWGTRFLMRISLIVHHLSRQARNRFSEHLSEMAAFRPLGLNSVEAVNPMKAGNTLMFLFSHLVFFLLVVETADFRFATSSPHRPVEVKVQKHRKATQTSMFALLGQAKL
jgi:hypothetical protein